MRMFVEVKFENYVHVVQSCVFVVQRRARVLVHQNYVRTPSVFFHEVTVTGFQINFTLD